MKSKSKLIIFMTSLMCLTGCQYGNEITQAQATAIYRGTKRNDDADINKITFDFKVSFNSYHYTKGKEDSSISIKGSYSKEDLYAHYKLKVKGNILNLSNEQIEAWLYYRDGSLYRATRIGKNIGTYTKTPYSNKRQVESIISLNDGLKLYDYYSYDVTTVDIFTNPENVVKAFVMDEGGSLYSNYSTAKTSNKYKYYSKKAGNVTSSISSTIKGKNYDYKLSFYNTLDDGFNTYTKVSTSYIVRNKNESTQTKEVASLTASAKETCKLSYPSLSSFVKQ